MRIDNDLLNKLRAVRDARNVNSVLPTLVSATALKAARGDVWGQIRARHSLPAGVKFKVELDGPDAGELRRKDTSEPFVPATPAASHACGNVSGCQQFLVISDDDELRVSGVDALLAHLRDQHDIRVVKL
jgi:hypothetical protein